MSFPPYEPVQGFAVRVKSALRGFSHKLAEKASELRAWMQLFVDKLLLRLPPEKRRMVAIASVGFAVFLLVLAIIAPLAKGKPVSREAPAALSMRQIPPDELFLPNEPDFVPGIIPDREQRSMWTAHDARTLWQDPLQNGEEPWRNRIEKSIDEIMESIP
ncbi:MAG: hypothetical protein LBG95_03830 [Treponema sp.]|jgi:hypothetical protein|nr:hypothetical protein [Treponema sp.]